MSQNNELRAAALEVIEFQRQEALDRYGDAEKAESWACIRVLRAALAAQAGQSEPVVLWRYKDTFSVLPAMAGYTPPGPDWGPLYTHPAPVRQPLTDEEIIHIAKQTKTAEPGRDGHILPISFARAIEAKINEGTHE